MPSLDDATILFGVSLGPKALVRVSIVSQPLRCCRWDEMQRKKGILNYWGFRAYAWYCFPSLHLKMKSKEGSDTCMDYYSILITHLLAAWQNSQYDKLSIVSVDDIITKSRHGSTLS